MATLAGKPFAVQLPPASAFLNLQASLAPAAQVTGLSLYLKPVEGTLITVIDRGQVVSFEDSSSISPTRLEGAIHCSTLEDGSELYVLHTNGGAVAAPLVRAVMEASARAAGAERREVLLLEELGANWESLEALYEISTDVLRSGNITDALRRLLSRLTAFSDGLHATLFIGREGMYHALVSTTGGALDLRPDQLGSVERALREMRVILVSDLGSQVNDRACWRNATSVAAAPFSWQSSIGFVVVWCERNTYEFDSSFSRVLEAITYQASIMMEGDRLGRKVRESELLAQEVQIASSIQQTLLLANAPQAVPALQIASCSIPSQQIDGDFHEFFQHPDGTVDVLIGDVMGKGVSAALLGAATKNQVLRATANLALRSTSGAPHPAEIITRAASRLSDRLIDLERFVTLCYARFDASTNMLTFTDCGHTGVIRERKAEPDCTFLQGGDLPLGIFPDFRCEEQSLPLLVGDTYLFYSDGVTESRSPDGDLFGPERLADCVQKWSALGPALLIEQIRKEAVRFTQSERFTDDFTCIAVRIKSNPLDHAPIASHSAVFPSDCEELTSYRKWLRQSIATDPQVLREEDRDRLEIACSEIFANCAIHAHASDEIASVRAQCDIFDVLITVTIRHQSPSFDPLAGESPSFDGSRDNGFGIYIVLRSTDEVCFARDSDGTNVTKLTFLRSNMDQSL